MNKPDTEKQPGPLRFAEASEAELVVVGEYRQSGRRVKMRVDAAAAWRQMIDQASVAGVGIIPISGFRSAEYQEMLFRKATAKYGSEDEAVRWVARPGFSEHHTGLAIDLGDGEHPACDVEPPFEETPAFRWLEKDAERFGFELSYPRNNPRGVHYEPWHWRFVGTPEAKSILSK
ncbi:MAG TPA: M15 family metallopeptidase [Candidatus Limnocylindrales bacterium]|nr:M15 family metallopeptidase [Candidatus Limnocylindrales bacterium]